MIVPPDAHARRPPQRSCHASTSTFWWGCRLCQFMGAPFGRGDRRAAHAATSPAGRRSATSPPGGPGRSHPRCHPCHRCDRRSVNHAALASGRADGTVLRPDHPRQILSRQTPCPPVCPPGDPPRQSAAGRSRRITPQGGQQFAAGTLTETRSHACTPLPISSSVVIGMPALRNAP